MKLDPTYIERGAENLKSLTAPTPLEEPPYTVLCLGRLSASAGFDPMSGAVELAWTGIFCFCKLLDVVDSW